MRVKPAEARGGSANPLDSIRPKGLKKAAPTNVVADLTARPTPAAPHTEEPAGKPEEQAVSDSVGAVEPTLKKASPTSVPEVEQAEEPGEHPTREVAEPSSPATGEGSAAEPKPAKRAMRKVNFHQPADAGKRMRSTYLATRHLTGYRSLSEFITDVMERECAALEDKYNDGRPFIADADGISRGRPVEL